MPPMSTTQLILVGGFLGAGKTTLLAEAARRLTAQDRRVGLIANDQAADLVDTAILKETGCGGRGGGRRLLLLPLSRHDRRHGAPGPPGGGRRAHRRAGGQLHRPVGHGDAAAEEAATGHQFDVAPFSVLIDVKQVRRAGPAAEGRGGRAGPPFPRQRPLHLRQATGRGRPDRAEQGRPALGGRVGRVERRRWPSGFPMRRCWRCRPPSGRGRGRLARFSQRRRSLRAGRSRRWITTSTRRARPPWAG